MTLPPFHWWRTVFFLIPAIAVYTIVLGTISLVASALRAQNFAHKCAQWWGRSILATTGVRMRVDGTFPTTSCIYVANHASIYDTPIVLGTIPRQLRLMAKIVTNDFNLNKVAQLRGVEVLNINELANSLKPVVLPGEVMTVFVTKEGKEYNQGVAYLDDGTMVVIDNARSRIGRSLDITVTSVLQTTAGRMIFGRHSEPVGVAGSGEAVGGRSRPAAQA